MLVAGVGWRGGGECGEQGEQDGVCQALEVDDGGGEEGLDLHVGQPPPDGTGKAVPILRLSMDPFDPATMATVLIAAEI